MEAEDELNLYDIPVVALSYKTRQIVINNLNKEKVLPSAEDLPRDWRGLSHLTGLSAPCGTNPTAQLLKEWERDPVASLGQLEEFLGRLDRWDVVDDIYTHIRDDAKKFSGRMVESPSHSSDLMIAGPATHILTVDDKERLSHGLHLQMYDALLLYADEDLDFATEMIERLQERDLKVCLKDNMVGGLSFEHRGIMKLIRDRCRHVIIIASRNFVNSPLNKFFISFAQAMSIERGDRVIIPCLYGAQPFQLPIEIQHIFKLDYNRMLTVPHYDFWGSLFLSLSKPLAYRRAQPMHALLGHSTLNIQEINYSEGEQIRQIQGAPEPVTEYPSDGSFVNNRTTSLQSVSTYASTSSLTAKPKSKSLVKRMCKLLTTKAKKQSTSKKIAVGL